MLPRLMSHILQVLLRDVFPCVDSAKGWYLHTLGHSSQLREKVACGSKMCTLCIGISAYLQGNAPDNVA